MDINSSQIPKVYGGKKLLMCIFRKFPYSPTQETGNSGEGGLRDQKKYMKLNYCNFQRGRRGGGGGVVRKFFSMGLVGRYTVLKYDDNHQ